MALLCLDLDNTLIDRTGAYRQWACGFVDRHGLDPHEVGWMMEIDLDGFAHRAPVFAAIHERFGLSMSADEVLADYRAQVPHVVRPTTGAIEALQTARARGWHPWLVTNGDIETQHAKIEATGMDAVLEGWIISDEVGAAKPDRAIFDICATRSGLPLDGAWMIGDNGPIDIGGATRAGIRSVWLHRNRPWEQLSYRPTFEAASMTEAIEQIGVPTAS